MFVTGAKTEPDWQAIFTDQLDIAHIKLKVVTTMLADQDASPDMIARLRRDVDERARQFDALFLQMSNELGLEHLFVDEAMVIEGLWSKMSTLLTA